MSQRDCDFHIDVENTSEALSTLREFTEEGPKYTQTFPYLDDTDPDNWNSLSDAFQYWRFSVETDDSGNVTEIRFIGEKMGEEEKMLDSIAEYVRDDSYIEMQGGGGEIWRWVFRDEEVDRVRGEVEF